ncbi:MAG: GDP-mannose 4,6-dehydratase [Candidatus Schekmanbacteria bacterium]|nr:GDP-mannose 4,6-dehydratase [Candidatus Schekmanbacteria bacterium]
MSSSQQQQRRALVTGAAGFVGRHLCRELAARGVIVHGTRRPHPGQSVAMVEAAMLHEAEISDRERLTAILREVEPTEIYHLAGLADVGAAWRQREQTYRVNVWGCLELLEAIVTIGMTNASLLVVGSSEEYGTVPAEEQPIHEDRPLAPRSPYGASKACQEILACQYARAFGLGVLVARPFNHAGPGQQTGFVCSDFARQIAAIELGLEEAPLRVGNLSAQRDFTDVRDVVRAYADLIEKGRPGVAYNVCSGRPVPIEDILGILRESAHQRIAVARDSERMRPSDTPIFVGSSERLQRDTGWSPQIALEQTLRDVLAYWRATLGAEGASARRGP